jgi:hypothetical protein
MFDECSLNFRGRKTVTADINDIVDTATDPIVALMITASSITSELDSCEYVFALAENF